MFRQRAVKQHRKGARLIEKRHSNHLAWRDPGHGLLGKGAKSKLIFPGEVRASMDRAGGPTPIRGGEFQSHGMEKPQRNLYSRMITTMPLTISRPACRKPEALRLAIYCLDSERVHLRTGEIAGSWPKDIKLELSAK